MENKIQQMKSLYKYDNYRQYLQDWKEKHGINYQTMASHFGLQSNSYIIEVIDGKKNLSRKGVNRIAIILGFDTNEFSYWNALVNWCDSKDEETGMYFQQMMTAIKTATH